MNSTQDLVVTIDLVGPDRARHMRDTMHFERQRKISDANVMRLAQEMEQARFIPGTQIYICVLPDGSMLIINGNHTLEAIWLSSQPQYLCLTYKKVPDIEVAARIYAVFDIHKIRTWKDSLGAVNKHGDLPNVTRVMAAINCLANNFDQFYAGPASRLERIELMEEYLEAAALFNDACLGAERETRKFVDRAAVMAVALETFRYQPSTASEFWHRMVHGEAKSGDPEYALLRWLRNTPTAAGGDRRAEHARAAAAAWNAAFDGRQASHIKPGAMSRFFLLGTPWFKGINPAKHPSRAKSPASASAGLEIRPSL